MFRSMMNYLHRVETILYFVAASRNADLHLHLEAGEALSKLFFAMDRIKYKRLWPRYIADIHALMIDHPETWIELEESNIFGTKNAIPCVSIGADHACEHLNKLMKVHAGLIGISNNPFPDNNHEEADTLMICLGVSATERNSRDAEMPFFLLILMSSP